MGNSAGGDGRETGAVSLLGQIIQQTLEALSEHADFDKAAIIRLKAAAHNGDWAKPDEVAAALAQKEEQ